MAFRLGVSIARTASAKATEHGDARRARLEEEVVSLFDRLRDRMLRYLSAFGLSISDGEEVIQEVFLALFRHLDLDKPKNNLDAWLFRVAHNLALKRRDRIRRGLRVMSDTGLTDDCAIDPNPNCGRGFGTRSDPGKIEICSGVAARAGQAMSCLKGRGIAISRNCGGYGYVSRRSFTHFGEIVGAPSSCR